jgi:hypothetical protein
VGDDEAGVVDPITLIMGKITLTLTLRNQGTYTGGFLFVCCVSVYAWGDVDVWSELNLFSEWLGV